MCAFILIWGMKTQKPTKNKHEPEVDSENLETAKQEKEIGGFEDRPEPTRFGDWEVGGRCSDF